MGGYNWRQSCDKSTVKLSTTVAFCDMSTVEISTVYLSTVYFSTPPWTPHCGGGILKGLLTKEFEARGRRGLDNNLCRCFHCDYSQLGVLPPAATCLTSRQLGQHLSTVVSLSPLYQPTPHLPLIKLVSSRLTGGLPIRPVPSLSIVRQSPSRFWRGKSRPEC